MVSGARQPGKLVPWSCFEEWHFVMQALYSGDMVRVKQGYDMVRMWAVRGRIPTAVEATGNLVMLKMELDARLGPYHSQEKHTEVVEASNLLDPLHTLALATTMALVRFVNEMVDPGQKGSYALPITKLAEQIGLPRNLVDLRHSGTHDELPSPGRLQLAVDQALAWLHSTYWIPLSTWRQALAVKCEEVLVRLGQEIEPMQEKLMKEASVPPTQVNQRLLKVIARNLNNIEHLQLSKEIQVDFASVLKQSTALESETKEMVVDCLNTWTNGGFEQIWSSKPSEDKSSDRHPTVPHTAPSADTVELLDETEAILKRLEEKKRLKSNSQQQQASGWEDCEDWQPRDLGSPVHFLDFVQ